VAQTALPLVRRFHDEIMRRRILPVIAMPVRDKREGFVIG